MYGTRIERVLHQFLLADALYCTWCPFHLMLNLISGTFIAWYPRHRKIWEDVNFCLVQIPNKPFCTSKDRKRGLDLQAVLRGTHREEHSCNKVSLCLVYDCSMPPKSRYYPKYNLTSIYLRSIDSTSDQHIRFVSSSETLLGVLLKLNKKRVCVRIQVNRVTVHVSRYLIVASTFCLDACLCPVVCCRWSSSWRLRWATHGLPPAVAQVYRGCPAWTHRCAPESRMTPRQRANPSLCGCGCWCALESWRLAICGLAFHVCWGMC